MQIVRTILLVLTAGCIFQSKPATDYTRKLPPEQRRGIT